MKKLGSTGQKILKITHLILASMWICGAITLNLMLLLLEPAQNGGVLHGYDLAIKFVDDLIIIPGAVGCLISGLFISWLTAWGFFRHRWVAVKWVLTVVCILAGTFIIGPFVNGQPPISLALGIEALSDTTYIANHSGNIIGGMIQLSSLIFILVISVLKPWRKRNDKKQ
jgi:hypothetical protein